MKKFLNHVDPIAWVSWPENIDTNVREVEKLSNTQLTRFERQDMGLVPHISWEAGLEVMAPSREPTAVN